MTDPNISKVLVSGFDLYRMPSGEKYIPEGTSMMTFSHRKALEEREGASATSTVD